MAGKVRHLLERDGRFYARIVVPERLRAAVGKRELTAAICESFGYDAVIVQHGDKIAALPAIAALGKNTSWGTPIESRNVLFLPR